MNRVLYGFMVLTFAMSVVMMGCGGKEVTTVEPTPEPPPVVEEPEPPPPPPPPPPPEPDVDSLLRETLQTVYFDFDRYELLPETVRKLETVAQVLREHESVRIRAEGHCDERGSSQYNMGLGENRASAVKDYLVNYGISANRIDITSYGKENPVRRNCGINDDCHSQNRRVEWTVLSR
ncbi:OmpA family protein [Chitinispirillales bacterium ANBcel5]|uniref:OmpA family protein n=1 Tax=Cellulosispirillum alkaliphilum TaxID=3039283 RepID=UPI002A58BDEF|nr:OmpA family protein [Chitinispirillales bacterium ANBcel5]